MPNLSEVQNEILRRFQRPRTTPGYAGGELKDQLVRNQTQGKSGAIGEPAPTPTSQTTRQRSVFAPPAPNNQPQQSPNVSGEDHDLPRAFKSGLSPGANGHWADTFKKPNHPTFSDQSQYAVGSDAGPSWFMARRHVHPSAAAKRVRAY